MPTLTENELLDLYRQSSENRTALETGVAAGCFYCRRIVYLADIREWVDIPGETPITALCPHCDVDSLLPGITDPDVLLQMHNRWFTLPDLYTAQPP